MSKASKKKESDEELLARIAGLLPKATKGEWRVTEDGDVLSPDWLVESKHCEVANCWWGKKARANADYIAALNPVAVARLISLAKRGLRKRK